MLGLLVVESGLLVGVFLPGDSLLFGAGLLVGSGRIDVPVAVLAASAWLGAVLGDGLGYGIGRGLGRPWVVRAHRGWRRRFVGTAERMYARHGWFAVVICRWFPGVRAIVPALAGVGRMHPFAFALANGTGALLWAVGLGDGSEHRVRPRLRPQGHSPAAARAVPVSSVRTCQIPPAAMSWHLPLYMRRSLDPQVASVS